MVLHPQQIVTWIFGRVAGPSQDLLFRIVTMYDTWSDDRPTAPAGHQREVFVFPFHSPPMTTGDVVSPLSDPTST